MTLTSFIFILCLISETLAREYLQNNLFTDNCVSNFCSKTRPSAGNWFTFSYNDYNQTVNIQKINIWRDSALVGGSSTTRFWADAPSSACFAQTISFPVPADTFQIDFKSFSPNNASAGISSI